MRTKYIIAKKQTKHKSQSIKNVSSLSNNTLVSTHSNEFCTGCHRKVNIMNIISIACKGKGVKGINNKMQKTGTCEYGHKWRQSTKQTKLSNNKKQSLMRGGTGYNPPGAAAPEATAEDAAAAAAAIEAEPQYVSVTKIQAIKAAAAAKKAAADAAEKQAAADAAADPVNVEAAKKADAAANKYGYTHELLQKLHNAKKAFSKDESPHNTKEISDQNWEEVKQRIINEHNIKQGVSLSSLSKKNSLTTNASASASAIAIKEEPLPPVPQVHQQTNVKVVKVNEPYVSPDIILPTKTSTKLVPQIKPTEAINQQNQTGNNTHLFIDTFHEQLSKLAPTQSSNKQAQQPLPPPLPPRTYTYNKFTFPDSSTPTKKKLLPPGWDRIAFKRIKPKQQEANNQQSQPIDTFHEQLSKLDPTQSSYKQVQNTSQSPSKRTTISLGSVKSGLKRFANIFTSPRKTFNNFKTGARKTFNLVLPQTKPKQPGADPFKKRAPDPGPYKPFKQ